MALLETDIEIFINRAQQKIATLGDSMLALDLNGQCIDYDVSLIQELSAAVELFQNCCCVPDENLSYKVIGYLNDKANLSVLPLAIFDNNCLVDAVLLPSGGFVSGPPGPAGLSATITIGTVSPLNPGSTPTVNNSGTPTTAVFNFGIPQGNDGADGSDGDNGWSPIYAAVQDGLRYVLELTGWTGGTGTAPTTVGVYIGPTGYVSDIASAVDIRGLQGIAGVNGDNGFDGWTPVLAIQPDGERRVLQVLSWIGGSGTPPISGLYVSSSGFTSDISTAIDIRGDQGIKGDPFNINASGLLSGRNTYDNSGTGFTYLATDTGDVYIKNSPLPGDWGPPISFVGDRGWSPVLNTVLDGERVVLQVSDWAGGGGPKPPAGSYIGQTGFTNNVSDATNIRGDKGEFFIDAQGPLSDRGIYDTEDRQFIYYANDNGKIYLKNSNSPADWTAGVQFTGLRGPAGPVGSTGPAGASGITVYDSTGGTIYGPSAITIYNGLIYTRTGGGNTSGAFDPSKWTNGLDGLYLKLDASNSPITGDLSMGDNKLGSISELLATYASFGGPSIATVSLLVYGTTADSSEYAFEVRSADYTTISAWRNDGVAMVKNLNVNPSNAVVGADTSYSAIIYGMTDDDTTGPLLVRDAGYVGIINVRGNGNIQLFGTPEFGGGARVLGIRNADTEPSSAAADGSILWAYNQILKTNSDFAVIDDTKGFILKSSTNSHYYRYTAGVAGALVITDLGTSI